MQLKLLVDKLEKDFPILMYKKGVILEDLAVSSGERKVIDYIKRMQGNESTRLK